MNTKIPAVSHRWLDPATVAAAMIGVTLVGNQPLIDALAIGGIGVIVPLALGGSTRWSVVAVISAVALAIGPGPAATVLLLPALVVAGASTASAARHLDERGIASWGRRPWSLDDAARLLGPTWALVAIASLMASTAEVTLFGIGEPIVRLTAIHYLYAGVGALAVAHRLREERGPTPATSVALAATGIAPPIVAAGFVLTHPVPQIGGAVLMTVGVWLSAGVLLARAKDAPTRSRSALRTVSGLTPWVPMVLAVAWATAQHVADVPALSIPDMARFHGLANGAGFVFLGLLATSSERATRTEEQTLLEVNA